jgi:hypothetical protein
VVTVVTWQTRLSRIQTLSHAAFSSASATPQIKRMEKTSEPNDRPSYRRRPYPPLHPGGMREMRRTLPLEQAQGTALPKDLGPQKHGKEVMR